MMLLIYAVLIIGAVWFAGMFGAMWGHGFLGRQRVVDWFDNWIIKPGAVALTIAFALLAIIFMVRIASAHEAPSGWRYDGFCCSDRDCRVADDREIVEVSGGWLVVPSNIYVPRDDHRIHDSPDGRFHICNVEAGNRKSAFWCLYIPPFGS